MTHVYIGIDNGSTGSVGIINNEGSADFFKTPTKEVPNYTKEVQMISRIDLLVLKKLIMEHTPLNGEFLFRALIERPFMSPVMSIDYTEFVDLEEAKNAGVQGLFTYVDVKKKVPTVNMMLFKASLNAHRSFEATVILMESMKIGYEVVDSKAWQKEMLGNGIKGSKNLKDASMLKGIQMFPHLETAIKKHKDADGIMIAAFAQKYYSQ